MSAAIIGGVLYFENLRLVLLSGDFSLDVVVLGFIGWAFFSTLAVFFLQLPIWAVLHVLRAPDWAGSSAAGAVTGAACGLIAWLLSNHPMPEVPVTLGKNVYVIIGAIVGAVSGFACWRVAKEGLV